MVLKELEAATKAIEEAPPVIKETPVIIQDTERVDSLTAEVERLKVQLHICGKNLYWLFECSLLKNFWSYFIQL